jgi:hypothetical protein
MIQNVINFIAQRVKSLVRAEMEIVETVVIWNPSVGTARLINEKKKEKKKKRASLQKVYKKDNTLLPY